MEMEKVGKTQADMIMYKNTREMFEGVSPAMWAMVMFYIYQSIHSSPRTLCLVFSFYGA